MAQELGSCRHMDIISLQKIGVGLTEGVNGLL